MRLGRTEKVALQIIGAVGVLAVIAVAPGMGEVFRRFGVHRKLGPSYTKNVISRLRKKGYIRIEKSGSDRTVTLTPLGLSRLEEERRIQKRLSGHKTGRRWDGKWRIVIFDIRERFRSVRDHLRLELREAGFVQLQKSVWVTPHHCEEFIALLRADLRIGKGILYFVSNEIEREDELKSVFRL